MRAYAFLAILVLSTFAACTSPTPPPSVVAPTASAQKFQVVQLTALTASDTHPGEQAVLTLQFAPMNLEIGKTSGGATFTSLTPWENANIAQMRVCVEIDKPCEPAGAWMDFKPEMNFSFDTDWLGKRAVWVAAQFRDHTGASIRAFNPANPPNQNEFAATQIILYSQIDERTPLASQPAFAQTAIAATRTTFPVSGSLVLQDGLCCAGGKVGTTITITATFDASSPVTAVTQMRLLNHCAAESEMDTAPWEPFVKQKTFSYTINTLNWVGWYLAVQYRDANGNLSPVYCDDISIEGMP